MKRIAKFECVSEEQFIKDMKKLFPTISDEVIVETTYKYLELPTRSTSGSAGYDFTLPFAVGLNPGEDIVIPTGIRCYMENDMVMLVYPRSSLGFKHHMTISNTIPVIDADYYNSENEGHIMIKIRNDGDHEILLNAGDRFVQGIFVEYGITIDDDISEVRTGGIGSTGK